MYRTIDAKFWHDLKVRKLSKEGKLFMLYRVTNPHSHFFLDVANADGTTARWKFEGGTPSGMLRNGYSPKVIKQGDEVTINGFQARDGSDNGMLRELITADGTKYGMFGPTDGGAGATR